MTVEGSGGTIGDGLTLPFGGYLDGNITIHPPFSPGSLPEPGSGTLTP